MKKRSKDVKCVTKEWTRGKKKNYTLTSKGRAKALKFIAQKRGIIALKLFPNAKPHERFEALKIIFQTTMKLFWSKRWDLDAAKKWKEFNETIELSAREFLNQNFPQGQRQFYDPYFTLRPMKGENVLKDAKLAYELGHYLTYNHIDVLIKSGVASSSKEFLERNKKWLDDFRVDKYHDESKAMQKLRDEERVRDKILGRERCQAPNRPKENLRWARDAIDFKLY